MDDNNIEVPPMEELRARPIKKIFIILLSFILAVVLLSITNVILAHVFVATAVFFPSTSTVEQAASSVSPPEPKIPKKKKKKKKIQPTVVETKTVYVPPTQEDLDRIRQELESSDPLPPLISTVNDDDNQRSPARIQSGITSVESLLIQRDQRSEEARKEVDELSEAFGSFILRLEQDTSRRDDVPIDDVTAKLTSLRSLLGRTTFMDLDREDVLMMFMLAMEDLQSLLGADEPSVDAQKSALFLNANNSLLETLMDEATAPLENSACQTSYLALDKGKSSIEFTPPPKSVKRSPKAKTATTAAAPTPNPPVITEETARESDLYQLVENIKHILSRRDLASVKLDEEDDKSMPSPIIGDGVDDIRSRISPIVHAIEGKWKSELAQESQIREVWVGRTEALMAGSASLSVGGGGEGGLCASPDLVEGMVAGGLESFRSKDDLLSSLKRAAEVAFAHDPEKLDMLDDEMEMLEDEMEMLDDEMDMLEMRDDEMERIYAPEIDGTSNDRAPSGTSSWKLGKKSIAYAVESPLLHRGVVGWIDYFVDAISGYNDHLDGLFDYIVAKGGLSVGASTANAISKMVRKIPFPVEYVGRLKKSGILSGRTRSVLEE